MIKTQKLILMPHTSNPMIKYTAVRINFVKELGNVSRAYTQDT